MQVSDMRALRALYAHHLRNMSAQKRPPSPLALLSCKSSQNPNFSRQFRYLPKRTIHSTTHRFGKESSVEAADVPDSWSSSSNSWDSSHDSSRNATDPSVSTVYDPLSGRLVTRRRRSKLGAEYQESELNNGDENRSSSSSSNHEDDSKDRIYGSVRRWNLKGGSEAFVGNRKKGKTKVSYICSNCGNSDGQWWGMCRACGSSGTLTRFVEGVYDGGKTSGFEVSEKLVRSWLPQKPTETVPLRLTDVNRGINQLNWRIPLSGLFGNEVARVLGGGLVPGSLVLVGGDPGIGKSTLLLQIAAIIAEGHDFGEPAPVVYVSGEESVEQIGNRADRMRIGAEELFLYSNTDIEEILDKIQPLSIRALIVDSIQTVYLKGVTGSAGGLPQVKECTSALLRFAKKTNIPVLLIGHVTKSGDIAGPRVLEHIVDVVLYMEGEKHSSHRLLRSVKNRFGSTDELGVFEMSESGLQAVSNPSEIFLSEQQSDSDISAGLAVAAIMDGSRTFLIEIQALCVPGSSVSRQVNGVQASRADMIISVK
ncbi:hypothetical protein U1Q18_006500 [Sarracenia purpurea var. burkii]